MLILTQLLKHWSLCVIWLQLYATDFEYHKRPASCCYFELTEFISTVHLILEASPVVFWVLLC